MASSLQQTNLPLTQPLPPSKCFNFANAFVFFIQYLRTSFALHVFRAGLASVGIFSLKLNPTAFILQLKIPSRNSFQPLSALYRYPVAATPS